MKYLLSFAALLLAAVLQAGNANLTLYTNGCADSTVIHSFDAQQLRLTAQPVVGHFFKQWSDGNIDNPRIITVSGNATFKAEFSPYCTIRVLTEGCDTPNVISSFNGQQLRLTAQSIDGHYFKQWSDGNADNPRIIIVSGNATYKAEFTPYCTIRVLADGCETPNMISSFYGQQLRLTAQSIEGHHFTQWSDGNTDNPRIILVAGNATYKAEFATTPTAIQEATELPKSIGARKEIRDNSLIIIKDGKIYNAQGMVVE